MGRFFGYHSTTQPQESCSWSVPPYLFLLFTQILLTTLILPEWDHINFILKKIILYIWKAKLFPSFVHSPSVCWTSLKPRVWNSIQASPAGGGDLTIWAITLLPRIYISKKLESGAGAGIESKLYSMRHGHPKWHLYYQARFLPPEWDHFDIVSFYFCNIIFYFPTQSVHSLHGCCSFSYFNGFILGTPF